MSLPQKTIERLSKYRRVLIIYKEMQSPYIFSHELAGKLRINPVHIRRDLMLIGLSGNFRHGYNVVEMINRIDEILMPPSSFAGTIIGMGKTGQSILHQIQGSPYCPVHIPVTFDLEPTNTNQNYSQVPCFSLSEAPKYIQLYNIRIAVLATSGFELQEIVDSLIPLGIEKMINCTSEIITVPKNITLRELNIIDILDEFAFSYEPKI